jgi:subtilase family serine protease
LCVAQPRGLATVRLRHFLHILQESKMPSHFRKKALVVALSLAVGGLAAAATPAGVAANTAIVTHATRLATGDQVVGALALTQPMSVTLSLQLRNRAELDALVADPHHRNLTPAEFKAKFGPTPAQVQQVKAFLRGHGFTHIAVAPNGLLVSGQASVAAVQSAFHTDMVRVRTHKGRMAFANSTAVHIPRALGGIVHEVMGLQNVHEFHILKGVHVNATGTRSGHDPVDLATIYEAGTAPTGKTVSVAVVTEG